MTAVEFIVEKLTPFNWTKEQMQEHYKDAIQQAKEMEEEQSLKMQPYDLDELAEDFAKNHSIYPTAQDDTEYGFKQGFQKALELLTFKSE